MMGVDRSRAARAEYGFPNEFSLFDEMPGEDDSENGATGPDFPCRPHGPTAILLRRATGGSAVELHFHLLFQAVVILVENRNHFGPRELRWHGLPFAHQLAEQRAGEQQARAALVVPVVVDDRLRV